MTRWLKEIKPSGPRQQQHDNQTMDERVWAQVARGGGVWAAVRMSLFYHVDATNMVKKGEGFRLVCFEVKQ